MKKTLQERYEERKREQLLAEGFLDYFKKGSTNIQTFNSTIAQLKALSGKYQLPSLQKALTTAEQQFTQIVMAQQQGQQVDTTKSQMISKATALVAGMSTFMTSLKTITTQLPKMKELMTNPNHPEGNQTLSQLLGPEAPQFTQLITSQLQKSGGGFLSRLKNFFTGSGTQTPAQVMAEFGLPPETFANELMNLTPKQMGAFANESASVKPFQLQEPAKQPANAGTQQASQTAPATAPVQSQGTEQPQAATPTQGPAQQTGGNTRPEGRQVQERQAAIQKTLTPQVKNAFNAAGLASLSNDEIVAAWKQIAAALKIPQ